MMVLANCTLTVYRGTLTNAYGDVVEVNTTPVATKIPASVIERNKTVTTYDRDTPRTVRWYTGRVEAGTDIRQNDRVKNEQTGTVYLVDSISTPGTGAVPSDMVLDLRKHP